ncbi:MAG: 3-keto-5-aminohexanoate cleavage protein [Chloroflexota bacterium]
MMLKAALNGNRSSQENPAVPTTPEHLAQDAKAAVALGIGAIHVHPRDVGGLESLHWSDIELAIVTIRQACPDVPIGISTREGITATVTQRFELVCGWRNSLDFASVNFHEEGSAAVARKLIGMGIGVEAGLFTAEGAENLVASGLAEQCLRIMLEPIDESVDDALRTVNTTERILDDSKISNPSRLLHGFDTTAWPMLVEAKKRGYDSRVGLEDTLFLPDGSAAKSNVELVKCATHLLAD